MRTKWASISTVGRLTLNVELMDLPRELGEFVIVHELIHMLAQSSVGVLGMGNRDARCEGGLCFASDTVLRRAATKSARNSLRP